MSITIKNPVFGLKNVSANEGANQGSTGTAGVRREFGEIEVSFIYREAGSGKEVCLKRFYTAGENAEFPEVGNVAAVAGPSGHPALIFQCWSHTPEQLSDLQNDYTVGAVYITADGETYAYLEITKTTGVNPVDALNQVFYLNKNDGSTLRIDYGDGTTEESSSYGTVTFAHTYPDYGSYVVKLKIIEGGGDFTFGKGSQWSGFMGDYEAKKYCALTRVYVGENILEIGEGSFLYCNSLREISLPTTIENIYCNSFRECSSLEYLVLPPNLSSIDAQVFINTYSLKAIALPFSILSLGSQVFYSCYSLRSISLPPSLANTGTFSVCYGLERAVLPAAATSIEIGVFSANYSLKEVKLPASFVSIGNAAFAGCLALKSITLPAAVTEIKDSAFDACKSLRKVVLTGSSIPVLGIYVFRDCNQSLRIFVPDRLLDGYRSATNWSEYANNICPVSAL